jgi:hypothetical protein
MMRVAQSRQAWALAVGGPLVVSAVLVLFRGDFNAADASLVLVLVVLGVAIAGGRWPGLASAVVSAACFDFFFTRPYYSFTINSRDDVELTVVLLVVALAVGEVVERARRSERLATTSQRQINQVRHVAELAAGSGPSGRMLRIVEHEVVTLLDGQESRFERPPFPTALPTIGHDRVTFPSGSSDARNEVALPVWGGGREIGRLVVVLRGPSAAIRIPAEDRAVAVALVDQLGALLAANVDGGGTPTGSDQNSR